MKALIAALLLLALLWEFREPLRDWLARPWRAHEHDPLPGLVWRHGREEPGLRVQAEFERWLRAERLQNRGFRAGVDAAATREWELWARQFPTEEERLRRLRLAGLGGGELERRIREHLLDEAWLERRLPVATTPATGTLAVPEALRVAHLFVSRHHEGQADRSAGIAALERRLREGADWQALVAAHSEDARSKARAGELGWVALGRFPEALWQAAARLSIGEVSGPVETPLGWHLLRLLERRPAGRAEGGAEVAARTDFEARRQVLETLRREAAEAGRMK
jgi:hypothetical protein